MLNRSLHVGATLLLATGLSAQVGSYLGSINAPTGVTPVGLGVSPSAQLLLTDTAQTVHILDTAGTQIRSFSVAANSGTPNGVTSDGTNFYVTDSNGTTGGRGVDVYDAQGAYLRSFSSAAFFPAGICWNPTNNHLYLVDRTGAQAFEYDLQGTQIASFPLAAQLNDGISYDVATNSFWVYEITGDLVQNYSAQFNSISNFPGAAASPLGAAGRGLGYIGGLVYVVVQSQRVIGIFDALGNSASVQSYGTGCPSPGLFYEKFTDSTGANVSDVAGLAFTFTANGPSGWVASRGGAFETNIGPGLNHADDQISRALALGFSFNIPGSTAGSTNSIDISSNGWIGLVSGSIPDTGFFIGDAARTRDFPIYERIAAWWTDLDPSVNTGDTHFTTLTNPTRAVITWNQVSRFGATPPDVNTVQVQLYPNGNWVIVYQQGCAEEAVTGFSSGGSPADPGSIDLTARIPGQFGPFGAAISLTSNRPVLGTSVTYQVDNRPSNTVLAAIIFGLAQTSTPLDVIGMTGCTLLSSGDLATAPVNLSTGQFVFGIPNQASLAGAVLYHQAIVVAPGFNPFGVVASNGLSLRLGM
jgi:hypothetical protein